MATYNYEVQLVVSPANGATEVPAAIEAEKVALFVKAVEQAGSAMFGIGETIVTILPVE